MKIIFCFVVALMATMSMNAQQIAVVKGSLHTADSNNADGRTTISGNPTWCIVSAKGSH